MSGFPSVSSIMKNKPIIVVSSRRRRTPSLGPCRGGGQSYKRETRMERSDANYCTSPENICYIRQSIIPTLLLILLCLCPPATQKLCEAAFVDGLLGKSNFHLCCTQQGVQRKINPSTGVENSTCDLN